jgi:DNA-binding beta-propeller fold protein YncE
MTLSRTTALGFTLFLAASAAHAGPTGYKVQDRIAGPDGPWDYLRVDAANNRLLVAHGSSVMVVDLANKAVTPGFAPGLMLHDPLPVRGGAEVLVTNGGTATAVFVDGKTGAPVATVKTGVGPDAAAVDPQSGMILVMDHVAGDVTVIDPKTHAFAGAIAVGGKLEGGAADGKGRLYVNVEDKSEIAVIDLAAKKTVAHYPLKGCEGPTGLAYDAADDQLIAACDGTTVLVEAKSGKVLASLPTGGGADGIAYDAKQKLAFVPAGDAGTLAIVKITKGKAAIIDTVTTEPGARTIALDDRSGRVYIPAVTFGPKPATGRAKAVPGTFHIIVVGK